MLLDIGRLRCSFALMLFSFHVCSSLIQFQNGTHLNIWPIVETNWTNCPVLSDGSLTINNVTSQCMYLNVPIDWNSTTLTAYSETLTIYVKRYFIPGYENHSHHLWRIPGGGGIPVSTLELEAVSIVNALNGSVAVYVTDKRGVGQSSFLECPTSIILNVTACLPFIQENKRRLELNTYTNTARDLEYVLKVVMGSNRKNLKSNQRVILMGSSQGTYLLQRYLHITESNEQVDGIILDSVLPIDTTRLIYGDTYLNYVFLDLFTRCSNDKNGCSEYFEDRNPMRALYTIKMNEDLQNKSACLYLFNVTTTDLAKKMSYVFYPNMMQLFPALIYRINRCNFDDQKVLKHFLNVTQPPSEDRQAGYSILVELNNNLAELWSPLNVDEQNPSCTYLQGISTNTFSATHVMPDIYCPIKEKNILGYPTDKYYRKYPTKRTSLPVLILHGDMDQALPIPIARHFYQQYSLINSNLTYIELPRTGHTATGMVPMIDEETNCGWSLAISFILSPTFEPDRSCIKKISPIDFVGISMQSKRSAIQLFGTEDIWSNQKANMTITNKSISKKFIFSNIILTFIVYLLISII